MEYYYQTIEHLKAPIVCMRENCSFKIEIIKVINLKRNNLMNKSIMSDDRFTENPLKEKEINNKFIVIVLYIFL